MSQFSHDVGVSLTLYSTISVPAPQIRGSTICERHPHMFFDRFSKLPFPVPDMTHDNFIIFIIVTVGFVSHRNVPDYNPTRLCDANKFCESSRWDQTLKFIIYVSLGVNLENKIHTYVLLKLKVFYLGESFFLSCPFYIYPLFTRLTFFNS